MGSLSPARHDGYQEYTEAHPGYKTKLRSFLDAVNIVDGLPQPVTAEVLARGPTRLQKFSVVPVGGEERAVFTPQQEPAMLLSAIQALALLEAKTEAAVSELLSNIKTQQQEQMHKRPWWHHQQEPLSQDAGRQHPAAAGVVVLPGRQEQQLRHKRKEPVDSSAGQLQQQQQPKKQQHNSIVCAGVAGEHGKAGSPLAAAEHVGVNAALAAATTAASTARPAAAAAPQSPQHEETLTAAYLDLPAFCEYLAVAAAAAPAATWPVDGPLTLTHPEQLVHLMLRAPVLVEMPGQGWRCLQLQERDYPRGPNFRGCMGRFAVCKLLPVAAAGATEVQAQQAAAAATGTAGAAAAAGSAASQLATTAIWTKVSLQLQALEWMRYLDWAHSTLQCSCKRSCCYSVRLFSRVCGRVDPALVLSLGAEHDPDKVGMLVCLLLSMKLEGISVPRPSFIWTALQHTMPAQSAVEAGEVEEVEGSEGEEESEEEEVIELGPQSRMLVSPDALRGDEAWAEGVEGWWEHPHGGAGDGGEADGGEGGEGELAAACIAQLELHILQLLGLESWPGVATSSPGYEPWLESYLDSCLEC